MIYPKKDMAGWAINSCGTVLRNADYYYTKKQIDKIIADITGVTTDKVQKMIDLSTESIKEQVKANSKAILERPTKTEVNNLLSAYLTKIEAKKAFDNYTKVEGETMIINENVIIE